MNKQTSQKPEQTELLAEPEDTRDPAAKGEPAATEAKRTPARKAAPKGRETRDSKARAAKSKTKGADSPRKSKAKPRPKAKATQRRKAGGRAAAAPPPVRLTTETVQALSAADERQISAEIQGKAPQAMLYAFMQDGHQVLGLSWIGVREAVRQINTRGFGQVRVKPESAILEEVTVELATGDTDEDGQPKVEKLAAVRARVYAEDVKYGGGNFGVAVQPRYNLLKRRDKKGRKIRQPDPFADAKAVSKAQRNAMEPFLPLELVEELKVLFKGQGRVEYIPGTAAEIDRPAALADDRAKEQHERLHALYGDFKKADPEALKKLPPGRFNGKLNSVAHDHALLDEFIAQMEQLVADAAKGGK